MKNMNNFDIDLVDIIICHFNIYLTEAGVMHEADIFLLLMVTVFITLSSTIIIAAHNFIFPFSFQTITSVYWNLCIQLLIMVFIHKL